MLKMARTTNSSQLNTRQVVATHFGGTVGFASDHRPSVRRVSIDARELRSRRTDPENQPIHHTVYIRFSPPIPPIYSNIFIYTRRWPDRRWLRLPAYPRWWFAARRVEWRRRPPAAGKRWRVETPCAAVRARHETMDQTPIL